MNAVFAVLGGDMSAVDVFYETPHDEIKDLVADGDLTLTRAACVSALDHLLAGDASSRVAQRWAAFLRRGFAPGAAGAGTAVRPLDIEYEPEFEEQIADVVSRLDEIGDAVDGKPPAAGEIRSMIAAVRRHGMSRAAES